MRASDLREDVDARVGARATCGVAASAIQALFLHDTRHGGPVDQAQTVAWKLTGFLRQATASIDMAIYDLRLSDLLAGPIVDVLSEAAARGVSVRIANDATQLVTAARTTFAMLAAIGNGAPVSGIYDSGQMGPIEREWAQHASDAQVLSDWTTVKKNLVAKKSTPYTPKGPHDFMHNTVLITDDQLIAGSYNISANAERNAGNQLRISDDNRLVNRYAKYIATIAAAYR